MNALTATRVAIKEALEAGVEGLSVTDYVPSHPAVPAAVITPDPSTYLDGAPDGQSLTYGRFRGRWVISLVMAPGDNQVQTEAADQALVDAIAALEDDDRTPGVATASGFYAYESAGGRFLAVDIHTTATITLT